MRTDFGLPAEALRSIRASISRFPEVSQAVIFGSRATGNNKEGSDVDIALKGALVTGDTVRSLSNLLNEELPLPWKFDVLAYNQIENTELRAHIDTEGVTL
jgi:predicted nucleotidyltransferase